jgi:alkanesulfonate monooxygenase SsuD/methylene tetrahydromethanopterin reductase-like flavin-dependent oxidoreductase (luciferase family)
MGARPVSTQAMRDSVPVIRDLMAGRAVRMNDTDVHFRWHRLGPEVPIAMSATGPRNLRAAGGLADIVMIYVGVDAESVGWAIGQVRAGAEEAGRDPAAVRISVLTAMEVGDDLDAARAAVRWAPAACANHIADTMQRVPDHGLPAAMTRLVAARTEMYDYYAGHLDSSAGHTEYLTPELVDDFAIAGSPAHCLAKLRELAGLGVWEVSSAYYNGRFEQIERVGAEIVPALGQLAA